MPTPRSPTSATGTQSATATARHRSARFGYERVRLAGEAGPGYPRHPVARYLPHPGRGSVASGLPDERDVLLDRPRVVADHLGDVQAVEGVLGDAAEAREEPHPGPFGPGVGRDVDGATLRVLENKTVQAHAPDAGYRRRRKAGMSSTSPS